MNNTFLILMIGLLTVGLMQPTAVVAQTPADDLILDPVTITTRMYTNGTTSILIDAKVRNVGLTSLSSIRLRIESSEIELVSTKFNGIDMQGSIQPMDRHTMVSVQLSDELGLNESGWVHLKANLNDVQSKREMSTNTQSTRGLIFYVRPHNTHLNLTFITFLPMNTQLSHESSVPVYPEADFNFTDGESIGFVWYIPLLESGQERVFIVGYQYENTGEGEQTFTSFEIGLIIVISLLVGLVMTHSGTRLIPRLKRTQSVSFAGVTSEEAMILSILESKGGSCFQREIYNQMEISQSKLSLILNNLEERGLVKRFREGRRNEVHLIESALESNHGSSFDGKEVEADRSG